VLRIGRQSIIALLAFLPRLEFLPRFLTGLGSSKGTSTVGGGQPGNISGNRRLCLSAPTMPSIFRSGTSIVGAVEPEKLKAGPTRYHTPALREKGLYPLTG
jgi:hypothetical protein